MKKISIIISLLLVVILLCGCEDKENKESKEVIINNKVVDTAKMEHKHCTREATVNDGEGKFEYDLYYTGDTLNVLKSKEEVISANEEILNTYENAYKSIHSNYEGLDYYDTEVTRGDTTVISIISINYDEIDINKLIEIEGEEDNIFENKIPKASKWLSFAKKLGVTCELVK